MNFKSVYEEFKTTLLIFAVIAWVIFLIIPMPGLVIDICISLLLAFSMIVLLTTSSIDSWDKIRSFPLIMLLSTIFRIALSIAVTRKIISGESPGQVIESAGHLIVNDNIITGIVMFIILIIVSFIIANGASRFGEVSARFMLDGLPGKQMSIDNELNQGVIDDKTAKKQKRRLQMQVDFYGNLDGAGKYIKGDVWVSVVMIIVNLTVGLIVGMVEQNLTFAEAANKFTLLTVGEGVVTLICALMITVSGAIVMAKVEDEEEDKENKANQSVVQKILLDLIPNSRNLYIAGAVLTILSFVGLPFIQFFLSGAALIIAGYIRSGKIKKEEVEKSKAAKAESKKSAEQDNEIKVKRSVEPIILEVGYKLAPFFMDNGTKDLFGNKKESISDKIDIMRRIFATNLGVEMPKVVIRDNNSLDSNKYVIKIKESLVASGVIKKDKILAMPTPLTLGDIEGEKTTDPIYGQEAYWISEDKINEATENGYDVWNPLTIIATHLHDVVEKNLYQFISLQQVSKMIEEISTPDQHPILKEKMDKIDDLHLLQKVIVSLLKEKVSIKDFPSIVESFIEAHSKTTEIDTIVSLVRQRISRQICENYINHKDEKLYLISLGDEKEILVEPFGGEYVLKNDYNWQTAFLQKLNKQKNDARVREINPVLIVNRPELRPAISKMLSSFELGMPVISVFELPTNIKSKVIAQI